MSEQIGLCFRCEYRAQAWEGGYGPRFECHGDKELAVCSCYMYMPVKPVELERNEGDDRSIGDAPMLGPRYHAKGIAPVSSRGKVTGDETLVVWWVPDEGERDAKD